jgi:hypothetical protein
MLKFKAKFYEYVSSYGIKLMFISMFNGKF